MMTTPYTMYRILLNRTLALILLFFAASPHFVVLYGFINSHLFLISFLYWNMDEHTTALNLLSGVTMVGVTRVGNWWCKSTFTYLLTYLLTAVEKQNWHWFTFIGLAFTVTSYAVVKVQNWRWGNGVAPNTLYNVSSITEPNPGPNTVIPCSLTTSTAFCCFILIYHLTPFLYLFSHWNLDEHTMALNLLAVAYSS